MSTAWEATERPRTASDRPRLPEVLAWGALAALVLWGLVPIVYLLIKAKSGHASLSGADSLFAADQLHVFGCVRVYELAVPNRAAWL